MSEREERSYKYETIICDLRAKLQAAEELNDELHRSRTDYYNLMNAALSRAEAAEAALFTANRDRQGWEDETKLFLSQRDALQAECLRLMGVIAKQDEEVALRQEELETYRMKSENGQIAAYYLLAEELGVPHGGSVVETVHGTIAKLHAEVARLREVLERCLLVLEPMHPGEETLLVRHIKDAMKVKP